MSDQIEQLLQNTTAILDKLSQAPAPTRQTDQSENVGQLAAALAQAQGKFSNPDRNKTAKVRGKDKNGNPIEYSYSYADLADILNVIRGPLSEAGLSYSQDVRFSNGEAQVATTLRHESGEWVRTVLKYPSPAGRIQDLGSIFTYLRRYSLSALIGIAPEDDDDGELAVDAARQRNEERRQGYEEKRQQRDSKKAETSKPDTIPTEEELERFYSKFMELAKERFHSEKEAKAWLKDQEPNPAKAYTKKLASLLGILKKRPVLSGSSDPLHISNEDPKQREAAQRRFHMLGDQKGLKEDSLRWWAGWKHGFIVDPEKGPSAKLTPLVILRAAIDELSKLDEAAVEAIRQGYAEHLEELRLANEEAAQGEPPQ